MRTAALGLEIEPSRVFSTRFQGSKRRVLPWLLSHLVELSPLHGRILDAFAGSGVVSYGLVRAGRRIHAVDSLHSSAVAVEAFAQHGCVRSTDAAELVIKLADAATPGVLSHEFEGVFYPHKEMVWLEGAACAIREMEPIEQAALFWSLFQSALAKRPYNLFHRANLDMRVRDVDRSFGNKITWETPFATHFRKFCAEVDQLAVESLETTAFTCDILDFEPGAGYDLVYLDPPYINSRGVGTPYREYYGFLDLLLLPDRIDHVDRSRAHKPLTGAPSPWDRSATALAGLRTVIDRFQKAKIAISYRSDGQPAIEEIVQEVGRVKDSVRVARTPIRYALSKGKRQEEVLIIGE